MFGRPVGRDMNNPGDLNPIPTSLCGTAALTLSSANDGAKLSLSTLVLITSKSRGRIAMGSWLSEREQRMVAGAETASATTPIPTQIVSNGEYLPPKQSETQKRVERRILELADENGKRLGLSRRRFMATGCGMAAAFLAMKEIYGTNVFQVDAAEADTPELIQARAQTLAGQFIFDVQTHFIRDDFDHKELLGLNDFAAEHWNPKIKD